MPLARRLATGLAGMSGKAGFAPDSERFIAKALAAAPPPLRAKPGERASGMPRAGCT